MGITIQNKRAKHEYHFLDNYEAGIKLVGSEIKSIREGHCKIQDAYCYFNNDELFIKNMFIREYDNATYLNHEPLRDRKLLLNKSELIKIQKKLNDQGLTLIPTRLYTNSKGIAKINITIARGKKLYDKREDIKKRDIERDSARKFKN